MHALDAMQAGVVMPAVARAQEWEWEWVTVVAGSPRKSVRRVWVTLHSVLSAMPWNMRSRRCADWPPKPTVKR